LLRRGLVAQWESAAFTRQRSLVRNQPSPPSHDRKISLTADGRSRRHLRAGIFVVVYLAAHITLPAFGYALRFVDGYEGPRPPAWEMFSQSDSHSLYEITFADGSRTTVDAMQELGSFRGRMNYAESTLEALCQRYPTATAVSYDEDDLASMERSC
jgi:hypothetical protein